jgi:hypothetical protein
MNLTLNIPDQKIVDLIDGGMEFGSTYWAAFSRSPSGTIRVKVWIEDSPDHHKLQYSLTDSALKKGLEVMAEKYPKHFGNFLSENDDAETSDVFIQCCCFGELIFG